VATDGAPEANADQIAYWNAQAGEIWAAQQDKLDRQIAPLGHAAIDALAPEIERFELKKFPRPEGKAVIDSPAAQRLPGNLPATHARTEVKRRSLDGLLEALPFFRDTEPDPAYVKLLQRHIAALRARDRANDNITRVMIMDQLKEPRETFILNRGSYEAKTETRALIGTAAA
jgi:hypothetical protein